MSRTLSDPKFGLISPTVIPIEYGGTGASTAEQAAINLDMIPTSALGQPSGVAKSDAQAKLPLDLLLDFADSVVMIDGPKTVLGSIQTTYTITNFDYQKTYLVRPVGLGTVIQDSETPAHILYTPPPSESQDGDGFIINGKKYIFTISPNGVATPSIITPVDGAEAVSTDYTFTSNAFFYSGVSQIHSASDWQIATDPNFLNIVQQVSNNSTYKTSWAVTGLDANTQLFIRIRHKGNITGYSNWSDTISFTTKSIYPSVDIATIPSPNPSDVGLFGESLAITRVGDTVVVGSPVVYKGNPVTSVGAVYVFSKSGDSWLQDHESLGLFTYNSDYGYSVSINDAGDTIAVGAPGVKKVEAVQIFSGLVYIYKKTSGTWSLQQTLSGDGYTNGTSERFGESVSLDSTGNTVLIGGPSSGSAYVFTRTGSTWTQAAKLQPSIATQAFGTGVSISADGLYAAISGLYTKSYVFKNTSGTWAEQSVLLSDVAGVDRYTGAITINDAGDVVLVGAATATITKTWQGGVYVFTRNTNTWSKQTFITVPDPISEEWFGSSLDLNSAGDVVAIGAMNYGYSLDTYRKGATYVFTESNGSWTLQSRVIPTDTYTLGTLSQFTKLSQLPNAGYWIAFAAYNTHMYVCSYNGGIYKRTNGLGNFVDQQQTSRGWTGMCSVANYVYACVYNGGIYRRTNDTGDFVSLSQTVRNWNAMCSLGNDVYACVKNGSLYKQTNASGNFVSLGIASKAWSSICTDGTHLYLTEEFGHIYKLNLGTLDLTVYDGGLPTKAWNSIVAIGQNLYAYAAFDDIYVRLQGASGFTASGKWSTTLGVPGPADGIGVLGATLYVASTQGGGIFYKASDLSQFGYAVGINGTGSRIVASMPSQNNNDVHDVGQVRVLE